MYIYNGIYSKISIMWKDHVRQIISIKNKMKSIVNNMPENVKAAMSNLGIVFKEARTEKKLNQVQLSKAAGCNQQDIAELENGNRNITLKTIVSLCTVFDQELYIKDKSGVLKKISV